MTDRELLGINHNVQLNIYANDSTCGGYDKVYDECLRARAAEAELRDKVADLTAELCIWEAKG